MAGIPKLLIAALVVGGVLARPVAAQPSIAKEYVDAGVIAQKNGDYATAIDLYQKANAIAPHPVLLFNIAQAHRLAGHRDEARAYYRKFLDTKPEGDLEITANGWLAKLDRQWAEEHPREEAERRAAEERRHAEALRVEQARLAEEEQARARRDALERERIGAAVSSTRVESERRKARTYKLAGLTAMGLGVIAEGASVYFGLRARRLSDELAREDVYDAERIEQGRLAERYMIIGAAGGGVLLIGGAVTYLLGRRIDVAATEDGAAVRVGGTF